MDAFEQLVAEILWDEGYWVQTSVKVRLTPAEKAAIGRPSAPAWELDVVGYRGATNTLIVIECKSFLDSTGVTFDELQPADGTSKGRYKLFCEPNLRKIILGRLAHQCADAGLCQPGVNPILGMAVGKFKKGHAERIRSLFTTQGWTLFDPDWLREKLKRLSTRSYQNQVSSVVAKLLLRETT
jgi:hypothetical protein